MVGTDLRWIFLAIVALTLALLLFLLVAPAFD